MKHTFARLSFLFLLYGTASNAATPPTGIFVSDTADTSCLKKLDFHSASGSTGVTVYYSCDSSEPVPVEAEVYSFADLHNDKSTNKLRFSFKYQNSDVVVYVSPSNADRLMSTCYSKNTTGDNTYFVGTLTKAH